MTYLRRPSGWRAFSNGDLVAALAWTALAFLPALAWQVVIEVRR